VGSTGHSIYQKSRTGNVNNVTFDIPGAVNYKGKLPPGSGMYPPGSNRITLKVPIGQDSALFQFRLNKDNTLLHINAYKEGFNGTTANLRLDAERPSLDHAMRSGLNVEQRNAMKVRNLFQQALVLDETFLYDVVKKLKSGKGE